MELKVKFHKDLLEQIVQDRKPVGSYLVKRKDGYQVNNKIKYAAAYYVLKSLTVSGVIQDYSRNLNALCAALSCSTPTFYKILKNCQKLGWVRVSARNIILSSYTRFEETFDKLTTGDMIEATYDITKHKFHHIMETAHVQLWERRREEVFEIRIAKNEYLIEELKTIINPDSRGQWRKSLQTMQLHALANGHEKWEILFYMNPFPAAGRARLASMFNFKSHRSVAYLKRKLSKAKLVSIIQQCVTRPEYVEKPDRPRSVNYRWDDKNKRYRWRFADQWRFAPILSF